MTDTTDIAALREKFESVFDGNKERNKYHPDVYAAYPTRAAWKYYQMGNELHLSQLEAERQRADYGQQVIDQRNAECDRLINEIAALKAKLANPMLPPLVELVNGGCILCGKLHPAGMQCPRLRVTSFKGE